MKDESIGYPWYYNTRGGAESASQEDHLKNRMRLDERCAGVDLRLSVLV